MYGIGPVKAQAIINSRPFESIDDLINVSGIGEVTLIKIKDQNLACVNEVEEVLEQETVSETSDQGKESETTEINEEQEENNTLEESQETSKVQIIRLTPALHENIILHDN